MLGESMDIIPIKNADEFCKYFKDNNYVIQFDNNRAVAIPIEAFAKAYGHKVVTKKGEKQILLTSSPSTD